MLSDITFGQFYPTTSFVHKLDPRSKIILLIAYIVAVFIADNFWGLLAAFLFLCVAIAFSKVPVSAVIRSLKAIIFLALFTFILNILFYAPKEGDTVLFWRISKEGIITATFFASRLLLLVAGSSILTLTTTPVNITDGIESLLKPLTYIKVPVHVLALVMSIALRFIPTLADETDRIIRAQKARGADFESGNILSRVKAFIPVLIPLLISAFRRADELGNAMDARCYTDGKTRTKYKKLSFTARDLVSVLLMAALITGIVFLNIYDPILF